MRMLWAAIQEVGTLGWVMVVLGELGVIAAFVAVLAPRRRRRMVVAATALGGLCAVTGGAGVVWGRAATDRIVAEEREALRPVERLRVRREGYMHARRAAEIGLGCGALPLLAGVVVAFAVTRRRAGANAGDPELDLSRFLPPRRGLAIGTAAAALVSSGFAAAARLEPVPGYDPLAEHATREIQERVTDVERAADRDRLLDACVKLEAAVDEYGTSFDRGGVPGLPATTRRCLDEGVQRAALLAPISAVASALESLSRSAFAKQDPSLALLVENAREEVRRIAASPPPTLVEAGYVGMGIEAPPGPRPVSGPVGRATVGGAALSGGSVMNASSVAAGMTAGFRRCYNKGLQEDPNMKGSVRITAKIGPNGEVLSVSPSASGLSGTVIACVAARVASAQFAPAEGGNATIVIPVTFENQ